ncbi:Uncharacterised protein [Enterobacter cloacae]|nr:Uncharacterised protein [Enterobacter cloacae]
MAALAHVTRQLLDPLKVNNRHHPHQQIHVARHIVLRRHHAAVQSFVKQHVSRFRQRLPGRERAGDLVPGHGFIVGVEILAGLPGTALPVFTEGLLQQAEVIRLRAEVADVFTQIARLADGHIHLRARVAVKAVAFYLCRP